MGRTTTLTTPGVRSRSHSKKEERYNQSSLVANDLAEASIEVRVVIGRE